MHRRIHLLARLCLLTALLALACEGSSYERPAYATGSQVRTIRLSPGAGQATLDTATGHLFVADPGRHLVEMRSAATGDLLRTIPSGQSSITLLLDARHGHLFVADGDMAGRTGGVLVVDTRTGLVLRSVPVGPNPQPLLLDDGAARLLVSTATYRMLARPATNQFRDESSATSAAIVILDAYTGRIIARIPSPGPVSFATLDARRHRAVVLYSKGSKEPNVGYGVVDINAGHPVAIVDANRNGQQPVLDLQRGIAMIIDTDESTVHVVNMATGVVLHTIKVDTSPEGGAIDPRNGHAYIVSLGLSFSGVAANGTFSELDLRAGTVLRKVPIGENVTGISLDPAGTRAFVALGTGDLVMLDTGTGRLLRTTHLGLISAYPPVFMSHGLAYAMSFGDVTSSGAIVSRTDGMLRVLDARDGALLRTVLVGVNPSWPPLPDPTGRRLFFSSAGPTGDMNAFPSGTGTVSVVDAATSRLLRKVAVGIGPSPIGLDPASGHLLVLNAQGDGTAPPSHGSIPVCSAKTPMIGPYAVPCRQPSASLSIIPLAP